MADEDDAPTRPAYRITFHEGIDFASRVGSFEVGARTMTWDVMALFHSRDGKTDEWWIGRDALNALRRPARGRPAC